jgi:membrane associated rhomboid family serine protease
MTLVALSVAVFILMTLFDQRKIVGPLLISEYIRPTLPEILDGELWRLFTPVFLHFGIFHIVFNMLWVWELGRLIEWRQGIWLLGILTLVVSMTSNLAQYFVSGPLFGGMSGVIYGYFGYVWMQSLTNPEFKVQLNPVIVKLLLGWFLICWTGLLEKLFGLNVANSAHTAGLVSGIAIALIVSGMIRLSATTR